MGAMVALVDDLIFGSRIDGAARHASRPCRTVRDQAALLAAVEADGADLVLIDMTVAGSAAAIEAVRAAARGARIVAFLPHVDRGLAESARRAGADEVMARSAFVKGLPALLAGE